MSEVKVNKVSPRTGTDVTLGDSGDTFTVPTGAGLTVTDEVKTNKISPASGTSFTFGDSGDTFTIPSGATITNSGTATGFGGGSMTKLQSQTASSASAVTFTSTYLTSTYKVYQLHCTAMDVSSDGGNLGIQTSTDNGSSYETGGVYKNIRFFNRDDTSDDTIKSGYNTGDDRVRIIGTGYGVGTNSNEGGMSIVTIFDPLGTGKGKFFKCYGCHFDENNKLVQQDHTFALDQSAAINNFKIIPASGTFSGTFTLYGIA